jgi:hypothetical protein
MVSTEPLDSASLPRLFGLANLPATVRHAVIRTEHSSVSRSSAHFAVVQTAVGRHLNPAAVFSRDWVNDDIHFSEQVQRRNETPRRRAFVETGILPICIPPLKEVGERCLLRQPADFTGENFAAEGPGFRR